jgi:hypothetical protein
MSLFAHVLARKGACLCLRELFCVHLREIAGVAALSAAEFEADDHRCASCSAVEAGKCVCFYVSIC